LRPTLTNQSTTGEVEKGGKKKKKRRREGWSFRRDKEEKGGKCHASWRKKKKGVHAGMEEK